MKDTSSGNKLFLQLVIGLIAFWMFDNWIIAVIIGLISGLIMPKKVVKKTQDTKNKKEDFKQESTKENNVPKKKTYSKEELKKVYYDLSKKYHPDLAQNPVDKDFRSRLFIRIKEAYEKGDMEVLRMYKLE